MTNEDLFFYKTIYLEKLLKPKANLLELMDEDYDILMWSKDDGYVKDKIIIGVDAYDIDDLRLFFEELIYNEPFKINVKN